MNLLKALRERVAPELNYLYTVPPFRTPGGVDCGWFSHEHALHTYFVARLAGAAAGIQSGDFAVLSEAVPPLTTIEQEPKHAWCSVAGVVPVDLSMTFAYLGRVPQLKSAITGVGTNGDWDIHFARDESLLDEKVQKGNEILFIERRVHEDTPEALLNDPYLILPPPRIDDTRWHVVFGPDIYAKISLHCHHCVLDPAKSVQHRLPRQQAMVWIAENYPAPEKQILEGLKK